MVSALSLCLTCTFDPVFYLLSTDPITQIMHILITGASGFIGSLVAKELLKDGSHTLILTDIVTPSVPAGSAHPENAKCIQADLCVDVKKVVEAKLDAIYVFHGIMSSGSEANFDLGMRVNLDGTRALLEELRSTCPGIRVIYASSQAIYGRPFPDVVDETTRPTPETSYGAEKLICETLINDYTRKGFIDGFSYRFPTITVRPGKPTQAASSFLSGMIREPLNGEECVIPIEDRGFVSWICSPKTLTQNLIHALSLSDTSLPLHDRSVNMPGIGVTVQDMLDALEEVAGKKPLSLISEKTDPTQEPILRSSSQRLYGVIGKIRHDLPQKQDNEGCNISNAVILLSTFSSCRLILPSLDMSFFFSSFFPLTLTCQHPASSSTRCDSRCMSESIGNSSRCRSRTLYINNLFDHVF